MTAILASIGIEQLRHKEMIAPVKGMIVDLLSTGKVGRNRLQISDVEDRPRHLTASGVDAVIDRFAAQRKKSGISCPDDYIKTCLLSAGRATQIAKAAGGSQGEGIHCGNPSYDLDDFVRLSMKQLHVEGEK